MDKVIVDHVTITSKIVASKLSLWYVLESRFLTTKIKKKININNSKSQFLFQFLYYNYRKHFTLLVESTASIVL